MTTPAPPPLFCQVVGLDLGRLSDHSALASLTWSIPPTWQEEIGWKPDYNVPTLHRWPLGTPYKTVVADVVRFFKNIVPYHGHRSNTPLLVVDATGVGDAVVESVAEQMRAANVRGWLTGVTITAGNALTPTASGRWNVAKRRLASILMMLLGNRRLHVAPNQEHAKVLLRELGTFQVKITDSLNESFESWRERDHDDLVLAVALACWAAETMMRPTVPIVERVIGHIT
jgi:hypothetical protein